MIRTLRYLLLFVFTGLSAASFAQQGGISGKVVDEKNEPLINAGVQVFSGGSQVGGNVTDYDGAFLIKPLDAGNNYVIVVRYSGYDSSVVTGVIVHGGAITPVNFKMQKPSGGGVKLKEVVIKEYKVPLINDINPGVRTMGPKEISQVPTNDMSDLVGLSPTIYQSQRGSDPNIGGARTSGTQYIIDGVMVQGTVGINLSQNGIEQLEVITSGISAKYGDVSGGIVNVTTRGAAPKLTGSIRAQHSIDGYNNNLVNFSIAGPLVKKKIHGDSTHPATKKPVLGFALSGDYYDDHDRYPSYNKEYVIKDDKLRELLKNPLRVSSDNTGQPIYNYASAFISESDLKRVKIRPHNETKEGRLNGKLDLQVSDNMRVTAGGTFDREQQDAYSRYTNMFASDGTPVQNTTTTRGFLRLTQKFGKANDTTHSIISNAYYTVQADFQRLVQETEDPRFKKNMFNYAYNGKFHQNRQNIYFPSTDSFSGNTGTVLFGSQSTGIDYTPSNMNVNLSNYTRQLYAARGSDLPKSMQEIQFYSGLANGDEPGATYTYAGVGLFASPGASQIYYVNFNSNQYALTVDASFDLAIGKTKHAIGFGLYYQQRIERRFFAYGNAGGTNSLWSLMRGLVSSVDNGNLRLDKTHPIFVVNGQQYTYSRDANNHPVYTDASGNVKNIIPGTNDTIIYNYTNIGNSTFDKNLRKKLGYSSTQNINIDELDPSTFSLNMFSADELLAGGNPYVGYYGYTYTGGTQTGTVNFNDYWTKKDANGNPTRPIGAFSPNYIAGYLEDMFIYKDIHFKVGVRIERYSSNSKVLIDPYSLYPETNLSQANGSWNTTNQGQHPGNLPGNSIVYVDDNNSSSPTIIGYRNGSNWYDAKGTYIEDPASLKVASGGRDPQPLIQKNSNNTITKITDSTFNPNLSFTDYNPAITLMPRLSFSFPISDVADFYAHYDIYAQRPYPTSLGIATPYDYYFLQEHAIQGATIGNPNLRPQKTYDYEVGFQQKVSKSSALTITAFYKERKNMIAVQDYFDAYPTTYYTYGNRDFSTTKGSTVLYDLRATNHFTMSLSYTLQFAEGTGSSPTAGRGLLASLIDAGLPNLRYITALDYDSRHTIVGNIDYRFRDNDGPSIGGRYIFQNAGLDLIAKLRSGEPYTAYADPLGNTIVGGVNGSRLPWHFGTDLRIDKNFALSFGKKNKDAAPGVKVKRPLFLKAILSVNNLLNTRDVLSVYGYTGKPDDNGYLSSSYGKQFVPQQLNKDSYTTLYSIYINNPYNLNYARSINFALEFNF